MHIFLESNIFSFGLCKLFSSVAGKVYKPKDLVYVFLTYEF